MTDCVDRSLVTIEVMGCGGSVVICLVGSFLSGLGSRLSAFEGTRGSRNSDQKFELCVSVPGCGDRDVLTHHSGAGANTRGTVAPLRHVRSTPLRCGNQFGVWGRLNP